MRETSRTTAVPLRQLWYSQCLYSCLVKLEWENLNLYFDRFSQTTSVKLVWESKSCIAGIEVFQIRMVTPLLHWKRGNLHDSKWSWRENILKQSLANFTALFYQMQGWNWIIMKLFMPSSALTKDKALRLLKTSPGTEESAVHERTDLWH